MSITHTQPESLSATISAFNRGFKSLSLPLFYGWVVKLADTHGELIVSLRTARLPENHEVDRLRS